MALKKDAKFDSNSVKMAIFFWNITKFAQQPARVLHKNPGLWYALVAPVNWEILQKKFNL